MLRNWPRNFLNTCRAVLLQTSLFFRHFLSLCISCNQVHVPYKEIYSVKMKDKNYLRLGQIYQFLQKEINFSVNRISDFESLVCNDFDVNYQLPNDSLICQNNPEYSGNTALHFLAESYRNFSSLKFYSEYLELLIKNGADVTIRNNDGLTPIFLAFNNKRTKRFSFAYRSKSLSLVHFNGKNTINTRSKNGMSVFHILCTTDNVELVDSFIKSGVDINERVNDDSPKYPGYTPLHFAVEHSCPKMIKLLLRYGADLNAGNAQRMSSLHLMAKIYEKSNYRRCGEMDEFIKQTILNIDPCNLPDNLGFSRLHYGCLLIDKESSIKKYFNKSVDIDSPIKLDSPIWPGCTSLHLAAQAHNLKTVKFLLKKGANILAEDANGTTALHILFVKNELRLNEMINILSSEKHHKFSELKLTDGTRLLDLMHAMKETKNINKFIKNNLKTVNTFIPFNSPFWQGYNLLHLQILFNDEKCSFMDQGVDFTMVNAEGMTPLHLAFRKRSYAIFRKIYKFIPKMPSNIVDQDNMSHLHIVCAETAESMHKDTLEVVECMLKNGADPNISTLCDLIWFSNYEDSIIKSGTSPLHIAIYKKNIPLANMLLSFGANPCIADVTGVTPFQAALINLTEEPNELLLAFFGKPDSGPLEKLITRMLESHGKNLMAGDTGVKILRTALTILDNKYDKLLRQLVTEFDREKRYEELGLTRLQVACVTGDIDVFIEELGAGADVNAQIAFDSPLWPGYAALHILLRKDFKSRDLRFLSLLLEYEADITLENSDKLTPFHLNQFFLAVKDPFLLKYNFTSVNATNREGLSLFHLCCLKNNTLFVEEFLKSGVDINISVDPFAKKYAGYTPLHFALKDMDFKDTEILKILLNNGADPSIENADGLNSCHFGCIQSNISRKAILSSSKIDMYAPNVFGDTALDIILQDYNPLGEKMVKNKVKSMIRLGYEHCYKNNEGKTALHKSTNPGAIKMLLSLGADINIKDNYGKTCVQYVSAENKVIRKVFDEHIQLMLTAGVYVDNLNKIGSNISVRNMSKEVEKVNLSEKLKKLIDPSFCADYFFSEKFVVEYKTMSVFKRKAIKNFCISNDFCDFKSLRPLIMLQFFKIRARARLLKPAESVLQSLIGIHYSDCLESILDYLKNDDLMNLVRVENEKLEFLPLSEN